MEIGLSVEDRINQGKVYLFIYIRKIYRYQLDLLSTFLPAYENPSHSYEIAS